MSIKLLQVQWHTTSNGVPLLFRMSNVGSYDVYDINVVGLSFAPNGFNVIQRQQHIRDTGGPVNNQMEFRIQNFISASASHHHRHKFHNSPPANHNFWLKQLMNPQPTVFDWADNRLPCIELEKNSKFVFNIKKHDFIIVTSTITLSTRNSPPADRNFWLKQLMNPQPTVFDWSDNKLSCIEQQKNSKFVFKVRFQYFIIVTGTITLSTRNAPPADRNFWLKQLMNPQLTVLDRADNKLSCIGQEKSHSVK